METATSSAKTIVPLHFSTAGLWFQPSIGVPPPWMTSHGVGSLSLEMQLGNGPLDDRCCDFQPLPPRPIFFFFPLTLSIGSAPHAQPTVRVL